jgi:hypothetical protein
MPCGQLREGKSGGAGLEKKEDSGGRKINVAVRKI